MAYVKISQLPAATALTGTEEVPLVQGGVTSRTTPDAFRTFLTGGKFSANKGGTDQTGIVSNVATKLTWSTEIYDYQSRFASSTWSPYPGVQRINCHIYALNVTACELKLYKNGVEFLRGPIVIGSPSNDVMMEGNWEFLSAPGDTFDVYLRALSPGTATVSGGASLSYIAGSQV